jgi:hypothetical protein
MHMAHSKWRRRIRRGALVVLAAVLIATGLAWRFWLGRHVAQWQMLRNVIQTEREGADQHNVQPLGWNLAILGRDDEIRRMDFHRQLEFPPLDVDIRQLELDVVPWRDGFRQIASRHRIVMMMEDHFVSKHREMIGAILPTFRDAGFTHYAAEAIGESAESLKSRGYPVVETGYYTSDPQFGNVIRRAIDLRFEVLGYDFRPFTHKGREEFAAATLANLLNGDPKAKLVVHAGHAHVFKRKTDLGQRWLASILWEKTGIEPFTIWQWSEMYDGHEYRVVADALAELGDFDEPVLLMPPPNRKSGLRNVPDVDAILVHPPDQSIAPDGRTVLFPDAMHCISGQWLTRQWPVVIAAYKSGEPTNAIPLDQVMLRDGEHDFVLWIPVSLTYEIVVFNQNGLVDSSTDNDRDSVLVRASK